MLIIPSWMEKKGLITMLAITVVIVGLFALLGLEYRNRNQRLLGQIREIVGCDSFIDFSRSKIQDRDPFLFPLKSRVEVGQFLIKNSGRLEIIPETDLSGMFENVTAYDQEFLGVVKSAPGRKPEDAADVYLSSINLTGVRSRLISLMTASVYSGNGDNPIQLFVSTLEANEMLFGGSQSLIEELVRQAVLSDFYSNFATLISRLGVDQLATEDLKTLWGVLDRIESPNAAIKTSIKTEILGASELIYGHRSQYFPGGAWGYLFEPDIEFFLRYQIQRLRELENIETAEEFTPLGVVPWYAIYSRMLIMDDSAMNNAVNKSATTEGLLSYIRDYLKVIVSQRNNDQRFAGELSEYSKISSSPEGGTQTLEYLGPTSSSQSDTWVNQPFKLP